MEQVEKLTRLALDYDQFSAGDLSDAVKMMHSALPKNFFGMENLKPRPKSCSRAPKRKTVKRDASFSESSDQSEQPDEVKPQESNKKGAKRVTFQTTKDELIAEKVDDAQQIKTRKRWTSDEQQRFEEGCKLFGTDYNKVSQYVGTRSVLAISSRFQL